MAKSRKKHAPSEDGDKVLARNRRAEFDYELGDRLEVGIVLRGSEVKSLRAGHASLAEAFVQVQGGELWLLKAHIEEYLQANRFNHDPLRARKLLAHAAEIDKLDRKAQQRGYAIIPTAFYLKEGRVKLEIAVGRGKKTYDKRESLREKDLSREHDRERRGGRR